MNSLTSPELIAQVNPKNMDLMEGYLEYMKSLQRSPNTIAAYRADLLIFWVYTLQHLNNKEFKDLTKRDIVAFQNWATYDNGNSPARVRRLKSVLSSLANYCERILQDDDPDYQGYRPIIRKIENPPLTAVREKTVWEDEELEALLNKLVEIKHFDQACCLALAMYGGRRKSELILFKVSDFNDDKLICNGALYKSDPIRTKGHGVNGKMLECYTLANRFKPYLTMWLDDRERKGITSEWLFPREETGHIVKETLDSWARTFTRLSGKDFYWHSLRHYYVSDLVKEGLPDSVIVEILGWSDPSMLKVYNDTTADDMLANYFDENGELSVQKKGLSEL